MAFSTVADSAQTHGKSQESTQDQQRERATFEPFSWFGDKGQRLSGSERLAADTHDIAKGIALVLEMVERRQIEQESGDDPQAQSPISASDSGTLLRFAIASAHALANKAHEEIEWVNTYKSARNNQP